MISGNDFNLFKEIKPKRLSDEISEQIKQLIFQGKLKPGDKLPPERELAEHFNVGRPCLREALNRLRAIGFLDVKKQNGYYVRSASDEMVGPLKGITESSNLPRRLFQFARYLRQMLCGLPVLHSIYPEVFGIPGNQ